MLGGDRLWPREDADAPGSDRPLLSAAPGGCGIGSLILWSPGTGFCDEVPKAAAYALGGALFAATQDVDKISLAGRAG